jgi:hypothetical protein
MAEATIRPIVRVRLIGWPQLIEASRQFALSRANRRRVGTPEVESMCVIRDREEDWQDFDIALVAVFKRWKCLVLEESDGVAPAEVDWIGAGMPLEWLQGPTQ